MNYNSVIKFIFSLMLRANRVADYQYLHSLVTDESVEPKKVYDVHCSNTYYTDGKGNIRNGNYLIFERSIIQQPLDKVESIYCEPIVKNLFSGLNVFRLGRRMLSGMFEQGTFLTK